MNKLYFILLGLMVWIPANAQLMDNLEKVGHFNEGVAAIMKGDQWAFMDQEGNIVIPYRDDLVTQTDENGNMVAPEFHDGRAMISRKVDGIAYYGFIDKTGKEVIPANFINASPFKNGFAIVMQFSKEVVGQNKLLGKDVVSYKVEEYVIDTDGKAMTPMLHTRNCVPEVLKKGKTPELSSVFMGGHVVAVQMADEHWEIYRF